MNIRIEKTTIITTLIVLLLAISALTATTNPVNAAIEMDIPTNCYIAIAPNPVGVGQTMNIVFWLDHDPPQLNNLDYYGWNYTVNIIKPDGTTVTGGPVESDAVGGAYYLFTPVTVGQYKIKVTFIEAKINITRSVGLMTLPVGLYTFKTSTSREVTLTVDTNQVVPWPEVPLPTGSWSNPVSAENRDWYQITGNWLARRILLPTTTLLLLTARILRWTKQLTFGGITGGTRGLGNELRPRIAL